MSRDESIENRIVKNADASFVVSQVMARWLVIIVKYKLTTTGYDSFWRLCNCKTVDLVQSWTIKSLDRCKSARIPDSKHTRNIRGYDLIRSWHPFNAYKRVVVTFKCEYLFVYVRIPEEYIMVQSC